MIFLVMRKGAMASSRFSQKLKQSDRHKDYGYDKKNYPIWKQKGVTPYAEQKRKATQN